MGTEGCVGFLQTTVLLILQHQSSLLMEEWQ